MIRYQCECKLRCHALNLSLASDYCIPLFIASVSTVGCKGIFWLCSIKPENDKLFIPLAMHFTDFMAVCSSFLHLMQNLSTICIYLSEKCALTSNASLGTFLKCKISVDFLYLCFALL